MLLLRYHNKKYFLPENFNELTGKQLICIAAMMHSKVNQERKTLQVLLNKRLLPFLCIANDAKARMLEYIDWIFQKNTLTAQLITKHKGLVGPKSEFDNLTMGEFHFTELFYKQIIDGNESAVAKLIAVLYRKAKPGYDYKKDPDGDARCEFNANEVAYYAQIIERKFSPAVKTAIIMWYDGCRQSLIELYDKAFSAPGAQEDAESFGMYDMIRNLSGDKFGTIKDTEKIFIHSAFVEVEKIMDDNERMEREMKKARS